MNQPHGTPEQNRLKRIRRTATIKFLRYMGEGKYREYSEFMKNIEERLR